MTTKSYQSCFQEKWSLGYQAQRRAEIQRSEKRLSWVTVYLGKVTLSLSFACSVPKRLEDRHIPPSPIFEKTQVLGGKTSTYLTMKKLEFTLLWSPPVTSPTYAHEAFQCSTQIQIGGQGSSGIWRKSYARQRQKQASRENRDYAANRRKQNKQKH